MTDQRNGGGLDLRPLADHAGEDPGGAGGSSGGGAMAGAGQPAGGTLDSRRGEGDAPVHDPQANPPRDSLAAIAGNEIAAEAAALGPADGSLADTAAASGLRQPVTSTDGQALGSGVGRSEGGVGVGGDQGDLGGGDPLGAREAGSDYVGGVRGG